MKVSSDFRVTVPAKVRMQLGMHPGTEIEFSIHDEEVFLKRVSSQSTDAQPRPSKPKTKPKTRPNPKTEPSSFWANIDDS